MNLPMNSPAELVHHELQVALCGLDGEATEMPASLRFDPQDPYAVAVTFDVEPTPVRWLFARDLLVLGLQAPAGSGDVHLFPCPDGAGDHLLVIELASPGGEATLQVRAEDVRHFVAQMLASVPVGAETSLVDIDDLIDSILGR